MDYRMKMFLNLKMITVWLCVSLPITIFAQNQFIELSFTALNDSNYQQLDSIYIENLSRGGDTTLYWPDTVLVLNYPVGMDEKKNSGPSLQVVAYPNPFSLRCHLKVTLRDADPLHIQVSDILGRTTTLFADNLTSGIHYFEFFPGYNRLCILRMIQPDNSQALKLINTGPGQKEPRIVYSGYHYEPVEPGKIKLALAGFEYEPGDQLLYLGYSGGKESGRTDIPDSSKLYTFQYASGITCLGDTVVYYEGKAYPTVQVFSQCWLQKNMDVGVMINGMSTQTDDGIIEKYCMANDTDYCDIYGGLYQWNEMMQYTATAGAQGICPPGWHVPTDLEWRILEGAVDSLFNFRDETWDNTGFRGSDAGYRLKSDSLWAQNGNGSNITGFNALPGGTRGSAGFFLLLGKNAPVWSSSTSAGSYVWYRVLTHDSDQVYRYSFDRYSGFAVRCLKNGN